MSFLSVLKNEIGDLRKTPLFLFFLILATIPALLTSTSAPSETLSDWMIAGNTFQEAATFIGLIACIGSTSSILIDYNSANFENIIPSGCSAFRYLGTKVLSFCSIFMLPGLGVLFFACMYHAIVFHANTLIPYLSALGCMYLPIILTAGSFGMCLSTLTRSRLPPIFLFSVLWIISLYFMEPPLMIFDITGKALNTTCFQSVIPLNLSDFPDIPASVLQAVYASFENNHFYASFNPGFIMLLFSLTLGILFLFLQYCWHKNASALLFSIKESLHIPLPAPLIILKTMKIGRLVMVTFFALLIGIVPFLPFLADRGGDLLPKIATPLLFSLTFTSIIPYDINLYTSESHLCLPCFRKPFIKRVCIVLLFILGTLCYQTLSLSLLKDLDVMSAMLAILAPTLFLSGIGFFLGMVTKQETVALFCVILLWVLFFLDKTSSFSEHFFSSLLCPLLANYPLENFIPWTNHLLALLVGIIFFVATFYQLGKPESLIKKQ